MDGMIEGYRYFHENMTAYIGANAGDIYIKSILEEINNFSEDINGFNGYETAFSKLKGDIAEFWHSDTHNIDAAVKGLKGRTNAIRNNDLASADIVSGEGEKFGLKYMANGQLTAKAQSRSYFQRYSEYKSTSHNVISFDEYLKANNIKPSDVLEHDPLYSGQIRIIPKEQMEEAISWLQRKIQTEKSIRPDQIKRYKETLDLLNDCVKTKDGAKSIPLSKLEAEKLAILAKSGEFDPLEYGFTTEQLSEFKYVMEQSIKSGLTAATISVVLKVAPKVYQSIEFLIQSGEIDEQQLKELGFLAV